MSQPSWIAPPNHAVVERRTATAVELVPLVGRTRCSDGGHRPYPRARDVPSSIDARSNAQRLASRPPRPGVTPSRRCERMHAMGRFYLTTPIYYVNAQPHLGHAYTTIIGDAMAGGTGCSATTSTSSPAPTSTASRSSRPPTQRASRRRQFADEISPMFAGGVATLNISNDDFIRTTEQRHRAGVQQLLQACYDAGDIELDVVRRQVLRRVRAVLHRRRAARRAISARSTRRPVEFFEEENYFFRLSRFQDRLLDWYARAPAARSSPSSAATRRSG